MDFTEMPVDNVTGHRWLFLAVDSFSAYVWGRSFLTRDAEPVAQMVMEVVADHGKVGLLCSDNGKEFCGEVLTVRSGRRRNRAL